MAKISVLGSEDTKFRGNHGIISELFVKSGSKLGFCSPEMNFKHALSQYFSKPFLTYSQLFIESKLKKKMVYVCRKEHFNAAHRLYNPNWSEERNQEVFGVCANKNGHGHNFDLIVTVKGNPDPETGFVIDMKKLGDLVKQEVVNKLDHKNLNLDVDFLQDKIPSCEVLVMEVWKILAPKVSQISDAQLHSIKLYETPKNFVEYFGEN